MRHHLWSTAVWQKEEIHTDYNNAVQGKKRRSIEVTVGCEEEATSSEGTDENLEVRVGGERESESDFYFILTFMLLGHLYVSYHPSWIITRM